MARRRNAGASGRWRKEQGGKNNKARETATDSSGRKLHLTVEERPYRSNPQGKKEMRTVYVVSGFVRGKKEYYNVQNAYDRMARWEGDANFKSKRYDREDSEWRKEREAARKAKLGRKGKGSTKKRTSGKKPSPFVQAGDSLRRLGYEGGLGIKSLNSLAKRNRKIKSLRASGATMKAWEGVERANPRRRQAGAQMQHSIRRRNALAVRQNRSRRRNPEEILDMYLSEEDLY